MPDAYGRSVVTDEWPRCWNCNKLLAEIATRPWRIMCRACKKVNQRL